MRKNSGPNTDPCGRLAIQNDSLTSVMVEWLNQLKNIPIYPIAFKFV